MFLHAYAFVFLHRMVHRRSAEKRKVKNRAWKETKKRRKQQVMDALCPDSTKGAIVVDQAHILAQNWGEAIRRGVKTKEFRAWSARKLQALSESDNTGCGRYSMKPATGGRSQIRTLFWKWGPDWKAYDSVDDFFRQATPQEMEGLYDPEDPKANLDALKDKLQTRTTKKVVQKGTGDIVEQTKYEPNKPCGWIQIRLMRLSN